MLLFWFGMDWPAQAQREIPPAFGSSVNLKPSDFAEAKSFRNAPFAIQGAPFGHGQNRGADFRLVVGAPEFAVGSVELSR